MNSHADGFPERVSVVEVGPRDGFQMEKIWIPTARKIQVIEALADAGLESVEATSFVSPQVIPQMADAAAVMAGIQRKPGTRYTALVPNLRGAERALEAGVDEIHLVICVTETYNLQNVGLSRSQSVAVLEKIVSLAASARPKIAVTATMAATFGCPFEGQLEVAELIEFARRLEATGIDQLGLADSAGLGHPPLVRRVLAAVTEALPSLSLRMHLHDTRGLGLANALAALEYGVSIFDTAFGGLGGCPMMQGATGNLATEDFLNLCSELGIEHGVDLDAVRSLSRSLEQFLGKPMASRVLASGTRAELYAANRESP